MRKLKLLSVLFISSIILSACSNTNPFDELADEINSWLGADSTNTSEKALILRRKLRTIPIPKAITKQIMILLVTLKILKLWTTVT